MVSLLPTVIAAFVSSLVVRWSGVCACARWLTLMVYFPAMALPAVVALERGGAAGAGGGKRSAL